MLVPHCFNYCESFIEVLKSGSGHSPTSFFFFSIPVAIQSPLDFHMNFKIRLSMSAKKPAGLFIGIS